MEPKLQEILKKVRALEIRSKKLSNQLFTGEYHSAFKGKGMRFKEVREYYPGDDIRFIDWNVSARFGHPYSKVFEEERERTVMLLLDLSHSMLLGSVKRTKKELMTEIAAILTFSALTNGDKTGAIFFTGKIEKYIPPKKGRQHLLYIVRSLLAFEPSQGNTLHNDACQFLQRTIRQKSIVFMLSDFIGAEETTVFKTIGHKHDAIAIHLHDPIEDILPKAGLIPLQDAESGRIAWVDSSSTQLQKHWPLLQKRKQMFLEKQLLSSGWDYIFFSTPDDEVALLQKFFLKRMKG
jgi:uncharacterized protein (DUF58 family)